MTTLAVTSVSSLLCHASTCFRIGSKLRCIRSTPTEMQSMSENDLECFASTGVNTPGTISPTRQGSSPLRKRRKAPTIRGRLRWDADAANGPKADENPLASGGGYKGVI